MTTGAARRSPACEEPARSVVAATVGAVWPTRTVAEVSALPGSAVHLVASGAVSPAMRRAIAATVFGASSRPRMAAQRTTGSARQGAANSAVRARSVRAHLHVAQATRAPSEPFSALRHAEVSVSHARATTSAVAVSAASAALAAAVTSKVHRARTTAIAAAATAPEARARAKRPDNPARRPPTAARGSGAKAGHASAPRRMRHACPTATAARA
jgi:hypothetical protein